MQIVWSADAVEDYHQNIEYLLSNWSEKSATDFIEEVESLLDLLQKWPNLFPLSEYKFIRRAVVRTQVTLFYTVKKDSVYLVRFWNTRQNPEAFKL